VAALYDDNFSCEGVLCLYGEQAAGKTSWCLSLMPTENQSLWFKDAVALDVGNKDSLTKSLGTWITELGEIDATFRKSDIEALKGFITERVDVIRPPYERTANRYRRRTVFIGTMNKLKFLQDDQNRRFWPINVTSVHYADFDIGQFWAEVKQMYQDIKPKCATPQLRKINNEYGWFLTPEERELLDRTQTVFKSDDPIEELLANRVMPKHQGMGQEEWLNCTAILDRCGWGRATKRDLDIVGRWCRQQGYDYKKDSKQYHVWIPIVPLGSVNWDDELTVKMKKMQKMSRN
jgi:putative DNA primase/helicase